MPFNRSNFDSALKYQTAIIGKQSSNVNGISLNVVSFVSLFFSLRCVYGFYVDVHKGVMCKTITKTPTQWSFLIVWCYLFLLPFTKCLLECQESFVFRCSPALFLAAHFNAFHNIHKMSAQKIPTKASIVKSHRYDVS